MATTNPLSKLTGDPKPLEREDREESFKEKLDKAAIEARQPPEDKPENQSFVAPIIEKVTELIPQAKEYLGDPKKDAEQAEKEKTPPGGPPERPTHDMHIEEFVRDQHRSKTADGKLQ